MRMIACLGFLLTVGCGTDNSGASDEQKQPATIAAAPGDASKPQDGTEVPPGAPNVLAITADGLADLPACDQGHAKALAYVRADAAFYTCDKTWTRIDIKGPKGDKGDTGAAGTDGTNGSNGTNGTNGTNGAPGAKGDPGTVVTAPSNVWLDPATEKLWLLGGPIGSAANLAATCSSPWTAPDNATLSPAVAHGLRTALPGITYVWTTETAAAWVAGGVTSTLPHYDITINNLDTGAQPGVVAVCYK